MDPSSASLDDLVHSVGLYVPRPLVLHGYIFPFLVLYGVWGWAWVGVYGWEEYFEAGLLALAGVGCLQILTCLFCHWSVHVRCLFTCRRENDPRVATVAKVVPTPNNGSPELVKVHKTLISKEATEKSIWFIFQKTKYIWDSEERKQFVGLKFPIDHQLRTYTEWRGYQEDTDLAAAEGRYGKNELQMDVPEFMDLFRERATAPFFVFQVFCVGLWCLDEYWYYSLFTLFMLVIFECTLVQQQLRNMSEIRKMGAKPYMIQVYRNKRWRSIMTDQLVPGDVVSVGRSQNDNLVPCDLLLLRGPCVVDESMLTGESVPQMKESLEAVELDRELDLATDAKLHVLFGGTKVVQHTPPSKTVTGLRAPDNGCVCYVLRTNFNTAQGKLLRTILYGVSRVTANNLETFAFILFLLIFAIAAASYVWIKGAGTSKVVPVGEAPLETIQVVASCHSLVQLEDGLVGDPQEKATLAAIDWTVTKGEAVVPRKGKAPGMKIFHRFHFSSQLKRMSVITGFTQPGSADVMYLATVKGAPETLRPMFSSLPPNYDNVYLELSRRGARVLALGRKELGRLSHAEVRETTREALECKLTFAGFIIISCPLKRDSKEVIKEVLQSSHGVVMITGDNSLTACHVAKELKFTHKKATLVLQMFKILALNALILAYSQSVLYLDGIKFSDYQATLQGLLLAACFLFISRSKPLKVLSKERPLPNIFNVYTIMTVLLQFAVHFTCLWFLVNQANEWSPPKDKFVDLEKEFEPSLLNSTVYVISMTLQISTFAINYRFFKIFIFFSTVCHIIKQGRCTLVTTLQMFKILALNALILAYSQSVLYLDGIKFSDYQATLQGLLLAACFLFISRSKPLKVLSKERPLPNIFNVYTIMTVLLQFAVHFTCLWFLVNQANEWSPPKDKFVDLEKEFEPSLLNSTVYVISMTLQISTFAINYRGHPFMESLLENKALLYSLLGSGGVVLALAVGIVPEFAQQFEIVDFPPEYRIILVKVLVADFTLSLIADRVCLFLFGEGRLPSELRKIA
ncbi:endoplasmic reticulum transmembrane helix translocase-like [Penaeus indicus]|uniref:endoplasmic reticulum transmembrane helix translocase-like n=1 Tax=Penaeus indicus TaxID=29960 RepID=UPI00300C4A67